MPPMETSKAQNGQVTSELLSYYHEKSLGGYFGLIITEHSYVSKEGKAGAKQLSFAEDYDFDGLKELVKTIHCNNTKVIAQINHAGMNAKAEITGSKPIAPSAVMHPKKALSELPEAMSKQDIERVITAFADAAKRAEQCGFDGVEIHSAHGYLLNQFYSPLTNQRNDEYGGSLEGRIKIHLEIIRKIKAAVREDFVIAIRLGACDYMEGGSTIEDAAAACLAFEQAGVDLLDISGGFNGFNNPETNQPGYFSKASHAIKQACHVPVILTGGITAKEEAEDLLEKECADLIGVGRAVFKDSLWAKRAMAE